MTASAHRDVWPNTSRLLPWMLAGFIAMLWLIPFDVATVGSGGPVDLSVDRIVLLAIGLVWLATLATKERRNLSFRSSPLNIAVLLFILVALASVILNASTLARLSELDLAIKQVALLLSYGAFYFLITSIVKPTEVPNFLLLMLALACVTAFGTLIEYRMDFNAFYAWSDKLLPSPFEIAAEPPNEKYGRRSITGPTAHGIAVATILAMMLPFAITGVMRNPKGRRRIAYSLAAGLLLLGTVSTFRKTGLVVPAAALVALIVMCPRQMVRLLPLGVVLVLAMQLAAPGALVGIKAQLVRTENESTAGRTSDYDAVQADIRAKPVLGRGHGTYDYRKYRVLDNEYLHRFIETGYLGVLAFIGLFVTLIVVALRTLRRTGSERGSPLYAIAAAAVAFGVGGAIFDELGFPQAPYLLFLIAGLAVCRITRADEPTPAEASHGMPSPALVPLRAATARGR